MNCKFINIINLLQQVFLTICYLLLLITHTDMTAQGSVRFHKLSQIDGLTQNSIPCIIQDQIGYMWFCTEDGLHRFDSQEFKIYFHNPENHRTLSNNGLSALLLDHTGRLWVGTDDSTLNLFNHERDEFERFPLHQSVKGSSLTYGINTLYEDFQGLIWIGTARGLFQFDPQTKIFRLFQNIPGDENSLSGNSILSIYQNEENILWIGTERKGLNRFHKNTESFERFLHDSEDLSSLSHNKVTAIVGAAENALWVGTKHGLNLLDSSRTGFKHYFHRADDLASLSDNNITKIIMDADSNIWIGTDKGLNLFNAESQSFIAYQHSPSDPNSLSSNNIVSLFEDSTHNIWVGTRRSGINRYNRNNVQFKQIKHNPYDDNSLLGNYVYAIMEDKSGIFWFGTDNGGLNRYDPATDTYRHYLHDENDPFSISDNDVSALYESPTGKLWVGTHGGGLNSFDPRTQGFKRYQYDDDKVNSLSDNKIMSLYGDEHGMLWIATERGGLNRFDEDSETFTHYRHDANNAQSISSDTIWSVNGDSDGNLWIGSGDEGLNRFDLSTGVFSRYQHDDDKPKSLVNNAVLTTYIDSQKRLWISSANHGISLLDINTSNFTHIESGKRLANNTNYCLLEDSSGNLWMSSNTGISRFDSVRKRFKHYDISDGLLANEFAAESCYRSRQGQMYFGGVKGVTVFSPDKIADKLYFPPVRIVNFSLFNKPVKVKYSGLSDEVYHHKEAFHLNRPIDTVDSIVLGHKESFFSIDFVALEFSKTKKIKYAYQLENFDKDWIYTDHKIRRASYTNIPDGEYIFRVRSTSSSGRWNADSSSLRISILPPYWKTGWAYLIYFSLLMIVIGIFWYMKLQRFQVKQQQYELNKAREISRHLKKIDHLKDEFLANTSHELRTPLNGIIGLTECLMDDASDRLSNLQRNNLSMIYYSGKRLANLVNDILDYSKLKNGHIKLQLKPVDLRSLVEVVIALSRPLTKGKKLELKSTIASDFPLVMADENRLQQILYNLIGNAIKFTKLGFVEVRAKRKNHHIIVSVIDTGIGIPKEKQEAIFESFEQGDEGVGREYVGTGLGLSVTKQLINLHGSDITVNSKPQEGTTFSFSLNVDWDATRLAKSRKGVSKKINIIDRVINEKTHMDRVSELPREAIVGKTGNVVHIEQASVKDDNCLTILIVDDDDINREILRSYLALEPYNLIEAVDGEEAVNIIESSHHVDLILLDVIMPRLSGFEVCRFIRKSYSINELPIIFLTAKSGEDDLLESFRCGGNDFMKKPTSRHELMIRVKTHLQLLVYNRSTAKVGS